MSISYSVMNMNTPDDLGQVVTKDIPLLKGLLRNCCCRTPRQWPGLVDYSPKYQTSTLFFIVFANAPRYSGAFEQEDMFQVIDSAFYGGAQVLLFTPDGSKLVQYHYYYGFIIYNFDRCRLDQQPCKSTLTSQIRHLGRAGYGSIGQ
ncbi:MAG: hypothetical protein IPK76_03720 [Lewinellaceae bacterium]|nr:hypothetical protein [Lewinellaceae bacterium]